MGLHIGATWRIRPNGGDAALCRIAVTACFGAWMERRGRVQDYPSHRMIEKRRRDRINSSLAELGRLVQASDDDVPTTAAPRPPAAGAQHAVRAPAAPYTSQARIKKTEIIELAIQRIRRLHADLLGLYTVQMMHGSECDMEI